MTINGFNRDYTLFVGDSETVLNGKNIPIVDLIITSPPYWNAIDYPKHGIKNGDWRDRKEENYQNEYLVKMRNILKDCYNIMSPGGVICINSGTILEEGKQIPLPSDLSRLCIDLGLIPIKRFTWNKVAGGVKRAGAVIKHPYPGYWHPNIMTEQIHVFAKKGAKPHVDKDALQSHGDVWNIAPVPPSNNSHPAPFPVEIPYMLIEIFAKPGAYILDPFLGSGSTLVAACLKGFDGAGIDLDKKYISLAKKRINGCQSFIRENSINLKLMSIDYWSKNVLWKSKGPTRHGSGK